MDEIARTLADAVDDALPRWVEREVRRIWSAWSREPLPQWHQAAADARREIGDQLAVLLATDIDAQRTNPLSILRGAVRFPTQVLQDAGVPPVVRPEFEERAFPDDLYGLSPASWRDIDESLHEPGLIWGAWKAQQHLQRRRAEGQL